MFLSQNLTKWHLITTYSLMHRFLLKTITFENNLFRKSLNNFEPNLNARCFKGAF
jgi:hypothetical protein